MVYDIIIIGGGAAGLCAAYAASQAASTMKILVIEKESVCGRKLSASGNGKGNLTNAAFQTECYHSSNPTRTMEWVEQHTYQEVLAFFKQLGILTYEKNGYYYPLSNQAKQVTGLLQNKCVESGVSFCMQTEVKQIHRKKNGSGYEVIVKDGTSYTCKALLLCTGGAASPKLGGSRSGYQLASQLGHTIIPLHSVLRPIYVEDSLLRYAKGVRMDGEVTLYGADGVVAREEGQIQWNEDNLSGIVMMNLSCYLPYMDNIATIHIDLLPDWEWNSLKEYIKTQCSNYPKQTIYDLLLGIFPAAMVRYLLKRTRIEETIAGQQLSEKQINRLTSHMKKLTFQTVPKEDYEKAQVTAGGIPLQEVDLHTMESKISPDLYLTGELLDLNGICGGYNLTFAFLSGIQAAHAIIARISEWRHI